jgi:hypothetical protein
MRTQQEGVKAIVCSKGKYKEQKFVQLSYWKKSRQMTLKMARIKSLLAVATWLLSATLAAPTSNTVDGSQATNRLVFAHFMVSEPLSLQSR